MKQKTKRRKRKHTTATKARKESHLTDSLRPVESERWVGLKTSRLSKVTKGTMRYV